jgi:hypothetical protein
MTVWTNFSFKIITPPEILSSPCSGHQTRPAAISLYPLNVIVFRVASLDPNHLPSSAAAAAAACNCLSDVTVRGGGASILRETSAAIVVSGTGFTNISTIFLSFFYLFSIFFLNRF